MACTRVGRAAYQAPAPGAVPAVLRAARRRGGGPGGPGGAFSKANGYGGIIIWTLGEGGLPANAAGGRSRNALPQALKAGFLD